MKPRHILSLILGVAGLCSALYSLPKTIEAVDQARAGGAPLDAVANTGISSLLSKAARQTPSIEDIRRGGTAPSRELDSTDELTIYTADGKALSDTELRELAREKARLAAKLAAARQAPDDTPSDTDTGPGSKSKKPSRSKVVVRRQADQTAQAQ